MADQPLSEREKKEKFHIQMCERVNELDASNETDKKDMITWITENSENFTRLKKPWKQYFPEICDIFVTERLQKTDEASEKDRFFLSLDFLPCIKLDYVTYKNEEIEYYDSELKIVTYLESQFNVLFKVTDSFKLLKSLDIMAADLNIGVVYERLRLISLQAYREVVMETVEHKYIGYYHFMQNFENIASDLIVALNQKLAQMGVVAEQAAILKMSIPEAVREQFRKNSYENKCENDRYEAEVRYADMYLERYRQKAEICSTYGTQETLTEFEKDRALERYLVRVNNERKHSVEETQLEERFEEYDLDKPIAPKEPTIKKPQEPDTKLRITAAIVFIVIGLLAVVGGVAMRGQPQFSSASTGIIVIGAIIALICALIIIYKVFKVKKVKKEDLPVYEEQLKLYKQSINQYKHDMQLYQKQLDKYNAAFKARNKEEQ